MILKNMANVLPHFLYVYLRKKFYSNRPSSNILTNFIKFFNVQYPNFKIKMLDIGARDGLPGWGLILKHLNNFYLEGIEPDKRGAQVILDSPNYGPYQKVHTVSLSNKEGPSNFYVTKKLGCSSIHKPNLKNLTNRTICPWFEIQKTIEIQTTKLSTLYPNRDLTL